MKTMKAPCHLGAALDREDRRALADLAGLALTGLLLGLAGVLGLVGLTLTLALCVRLFLLVVGA